MAIQTGTKTEGNTKKEYIPDSPVSPSMKWTSSNEKIAKVQLSGDGTTATVTAVAGAKGKVTITGMAMDGSGKKATVTFNVVQPVNSIGITGPKFISKGDKTTFKASIDPSSANNKKVTWSLNDGAAENGVSINPANGTVTVSPTASETEYTVTATSTDLSGTKGTYSFKAVAAKTNTVLITPHPDSKSKENSAVINKVKYTKKTFAGITPDLETFSTLQLYNEGITEQDWNVTEFKVKGNLISSYKESGKTKYSIIEGDSRPVWTSGNEAVVTVSDEDADGYVTLTGKAAGTAVITCAANDGSGKKATIRVTVVQPVETIDITGQRYIPLGQKATYKASCLPLNAAVKAVSWRVYEKNNEDKMVEVAPDKITVSSGGQVSVKKGASLKQYYLYAFSSDGATQSHKEFTVTASKAASVKIEDDPEGVRDKDKYDSVHNIVTNSQNNGSISSLRLYTEDIDKNDPTGNPLYENQIELKGILMDNSKPAKPLSDGCEVIWTSNNTSVADISQYGNNVTVLGKKPGTATLTCAADDGSGKKATVKVTVITPVSSMTLTSQGSDDSIVAMGRSVPLKLTFGNDYGIPSNRKVTWTYRINPDPQNDENYWVDEDDNDYGKGKYAKISGGKLSIPKRLPKFEDPIWEDYHYRVEVKATATDGTGRYATHIFDVLPDTVKLGIRTKDGKFHECNFVYPDPLNIDNDIDSSYKIPAISLFYYDEHGIKQRTGDNRRINVKSSDPDIASAHFSAPNLVIYPKKAGDVTLTLIAIDGSGTTGTVTFHVVDN